MELVRRVYALLAANGARVEVLWRGTMLHNTMDEYRRMPLRNAIARSSASRSC